MRAQARDCRGDRGAATTELVIVLPVLIAFLLLAVAAGRLTDARSDLVGAAGDAARVASLQRSPDAARAQAQAAATDTVAGERLNCSGGPRVDVAFEPDFSRGSSVHVVVTCTIATRDLTAVGLPVTVTLVEDAWEVIDTHRSL